MLKLRSQKPFLFLIALVAIIQNGQKVLFAAFVYQFLLLLDFVCNLLEAINRGVDVELRGALFYQVSEYSGVSIILKASYLSNDVVLLVG